MRMRVQKVIYFKFSRNMYFNIYTFLSPENPISIQGHPAEIFSVTS